MIAFGLVHFRTWLRWEACLQGCTLECGSAQDDL